MSRRKTAKEREQEKRDALLQRVQDIYAGACGRAMDGEDDSFAAPDELARVIPSLMDVFGTCREVRHVWGHHNLGLFETPGQAATFLFNNGFRADEVWVGEPEDEEVSS